MKSDAEIRADVINELYWDPQVTEPEAIGVAVRDGAVTLTGHVPSYAEKPAAARAAERVYGVKAVANDLKVQLSRAPRDDSDIARAIAHILEWNVQIPEGKVHARVENGWVTLDGEVDYAYQKREVERMVNHVRGVAGVRNFITVRPPASPEAVDAAIEQAFKREAEVDARHVKVEVTDHNAKLYGHVHSMREASAAADGAGPRPRPVHCAAQRLVQADLHVGQRGERCQDGLGTGQRQRDQVGEDGGHGQPGDGLRGRLSSVPDQGQRLGAPYATTRAVAPIGMTLRWVNLGMANAPACRTPARPPSPVRLARCHVPALN